MVARGVPGGVWGLSSQCGHVTGFHGNAILEILKRRAPEPEPPKKLLKGDRLLSTNSAFVERGTDRPVVFVLVQLVM